MYTAVVLFELRIWYDALKTQHRANHGKSGLWKSAIPLSTNNTGSSIFLTINIQYAIIYINSFVFVNFIVMVKNVSTCFYRNGSTDLVF